MIRSRIFGTIMIWLVNWKYRDITKIELKQSMQLQFNKQQNTVANILKY